VLIWDRPIHLFVLIGKAEMFTLISELNWPGKSKQKVKGGNKKKVPREK